MGGSAAAQPQAWGDQASAARPSEGARPFRRTSKAAREAGCHGQGCAPGSRQRGIILLVAMVAVLALGLVGMSLVRAVATSVAIGSNIDARQQAIFAASAALEHDIVALFEDRVIDTANDDPSHNYFASRQPGEDRRGVPQMLLSMSDYPPGAAIIDAGDGFSVRHVVERMCLLPGAATIDNCALSPPSVEAASGTPPPGEPPRQAAYRVTMRVAGPGGAASFLQAMVSEAHANPRLSWQVLDE